MSSSSKSDLAGKALHEELQKAIDDDKMYWVQNDAKLRAVVTSKTYDEFRYEIAYLS